MSSRTLAIGSPLADYDKLGTDEPETYDTRPDKAAARARGKVYIYYSEPAVQVLFFRSGLSTIEGIENREILLLIGRNL